MKNIKHWIVSVLAIGVAAYLLPGVEVTIIGALVLAVVWTLINTFIKPVIFILTLPINILTIGLFSLVINGLLILLAAKIVQGFEVAGFWSAFFFAIILSLINMVLLQKITNKPF
jgi:putative membrane protein